MNFLIIITGLLMVVQHFPFGFSARAKIKSIIFKSTEINFNKEYISNFTMQISPDGSTFDCEVIFIQDIIDSYWILLSVEMMLPSTNNYRSLFKYDIDACSILGTKDMNIVALWMQNIMKYSNLPKSCPIRKGSYIWQNFKVNQNSIPAFVINGLYRIKASNYIKGSSENLDLINVTLNVEVKMK
ncbi:uncharacterized protein LOC142235297 [Haematobia irritans]|uniref:uncharacterized protein LOC142235297 n=1 Tax=Haematobia irritans TaxID=7368 RepID=UPI003F4F8F44